MATGASSSVGGVKGDVPRLVMDVPSSDSNEGTADVRRAGWSIELRVMFAEYWAPADDTVAV